jgi:hypothetical protein
MKTKGEAFLSACWSGSRDDSLHSLAGSPSQSSITCVGMWAGVDQVADWLEDTARSDS